MRTARFCGFGAGGTVLGGYGPGEYGPGEHCEKALPPPPPWTEWQTPVKTLPSRNFVCGR